MAKYYGDIKRLVEICRPFSSSMVAGYALGLVELYQADNKMKIEYYQRN